MAHNITVIGPEESGAPTDYDNALQLHSGSANYYRPYDPSSYPMRESTLPRPHLTHLQTQSTESAQTHSGDASAGAGNDHTNLSAMSSSHVLSAPSAGWTMAEELSPGSGSPTYLSTASPLSQGWSPLTPNTPLTAASSPAVGTLPFPGLQGNYSNDYLRIIPQNDRYSSSASIAVRGRPMHHACSQPNLRTQAATGPYRAPQAYTQSPLYHHEYVGISPAGSWALLNQAYSPPLGAELTTLPPSPVINDHEAVHASTARHSSDMDEGYRHSSYSSLAGAVPMLTATRASANREMDIDAQPISAQHAPRSCPDSNNPLGASVVHVYDGPTAHYSATSEAATKTESTDLTDSTNLVSQTQLAPSPRNINYSPQRPARVHQYQDDTNLVFNGMPIPGPLIPQIKYRPATASDHRRYVIEATLMPPVYFTSSQSTRAGISLTDALLLRTVGMDGPHDNCVEGCGPSISLRLMWTGYPAWTKQIPTKDYKTPPQWITRARLARQISKALLGFFEENSRLPMDAREDPRWRIGPQGIKHEDLVLISLHHVSKGSWQINLCLNRPL